jgi:hypothetical protein
MKRKSISYANFKQGESARARRMRQLASQKPSKKEVEAALAFIQPPKENPYQRLLRKLDMDRMERSGKGLQ